MPRSRVANFDWKFEEKLMFVKMAWGNGLMERATGTADAARAVTAYLDAFDRLPYDGYEFPSTVLYAWRKEVLAHAATCEYTKEKIFRRAS